MPDFSKHYSDGSFWSTIRKFAGKIPFLRDALAMYYCLNDSDTPGWVKVLIIGALGYFIFPLDAVPDFIPVAGMADDAGVIAAALAAIRFHIKEEHWQKADEWIRG